jgi:hypothetical protein
MCYVLYCRNRWYCCCVTPWNVARDSRCDSWPCITSIVVIIYSLPPRDAILRHSYPPLWRHHEPCIDRRGPTWNSGRSNHSYVSDQTRLVDYKSHVKIPIPWPLVGVQFVGWGGIGTWRPAWTARFVAHKCTWSCEYLMQNINMREGRLKHCVFCVSDSEW